MESRAENDERRVLLVSDSESGELGAVTGLDESGNIKTTKPEYNNFGDFLSIQEDNALEAFFSKFLDQADDPSHLGFYLTPANLLDKLTNMTDIELVSELDQYQFEPDEFLAYQEASRLNKQESKEQSNAHSEQTKSTTQQQSNQQPEGEFTFQPYDQSKIDWEQLKELGVSMEEVEPNLKAMLYHHKSPRLVNMNFDIEGEQITTKGRLSLTEQPDGTLRFTPHYYRQEIDLDSPFYGVLFTEEDKRNLVESKHVGRIVELEPTKGEKVNCFVSADKLTNELFALPVESITVPKQIKGVELTAEQRQGMAEGKRVLVEGMTSRSDKPFDAYLQFNAADNRIDFTYEGIDRRRYQKQEESGVVIPDRLLGVRLSEDQQKAMGARDAVYIRNMTSKQTGDKFSAWVKVDDNAGVLRFYKWKPRETTQQQGKEQREQKPTQQKPERGLKPKAPTKGKGRKL